MMPADDGSSERLLVERLRAGDEGAAEDLLRLYGPRLLAVARRMLRNDEDAQDALHDAFLSAFRALRTFRGECRLSTWLHRITVNAALMKMRSRRRRRETPIEDLLPVYLEDGHHVTRFQAWTDAERALDHAETRAAVRAAIDELPESYRTVLLMRDIEELDTDTVAGLLGVTPNAVKIRLHRARQALATLLRPVLGPEAGASGYASASPPQRGPSR
ncbi:MAG: sigma-70 family RNA polymerase sigma factor [Acidobacteriota bacterium]